MAKNSKQTSRKVASTASKILRDGRYGSKAKSVAGSALAGKAKEIGWIGAENDLNNQPALPAREKYYFVRTFYNN